MAKTTPYASVEKATKELLRIPLTEIVELEKGNDAKLGKLKKLAKALRSVESKANVEIFKPC